mmetsp:Transcript_66069/g.158015  ORF Transcript_66069/g.158015 Transcript_66069/m.158015 type:complete len:236 (+) Transcript_66069:46-753(+)
MPPQGWGGSSGSRGSAAAATESAVQKLANKNRCCSRPSEYFPLLGVRLSESAHRCRKFPTLASEACARRTHRNVPMQLLVHTLLTRVVRRVGLQFVQQLLDGRLAREEVVRKAAQKVGRPPGAPLAIILEGVRVSELHMVMLLVMRLEEHELVRLRQLLSSSNLLPVVWTLHGVLLPDGRRRRQLWKREVRSHPVCHATPEAVNTLLLDVRPQVTGVLKELVAIRVDHPGPRGQS